ncbi:MAG: hypothetical protein A2X13_06260 [Bacteroidetes bacterium GWC2_33_15]|nr:MAG: hypothetical protein A2X10_13375 [Bacteroidetes bacterium GWA2_33_15]OFX49270.1 MAG: hypothetical protein A2X13_06260 [Bacteroidetes bacterium GWC2_33_15]OFX65465.1 MAG: hypothetical protein A2X15_00430 [Bacteroidetes bacterium GWB2_32_14]OFX69581.1 MAG: hypothetical protein A2X14_01985 [Bacteroidetes bacterium GWD2_33_33]
MTIDNIIAGLGLIGIGGLLKVGFDYLIATKKAKTDAKQEFKEKRYKAIILLCYSLVYYDREKTTLIINRPDIQSKERLINEIMAEFINMSLYASDKVIYTMKKFIELQNNQALNNIALSMRKDLYGIRTKLKGDEFEISVKFD